MDSPTNKTIEELRQEAGVEINESGEIVEKRTPKRQVFPPKTRVRNIWDEVTTLFNRVESLTSDTAILGFVAGMYPELNKLKARTEALPEDQFADTLVRAGFASVVINVGDTVRVKDQYVEDYFLTDNDAKQGVVQSIREKTNKEGTITSTIIRFLDEKSGIPVPVTKGHVTLIARADGTPV